MSFFQTVIAVIRKRNTWITFVAIIALFLLYLTGITTNPPGFYVDESGLAYNAYLVSETGAGEFGPPFPLFFQLYTGGFTQYSNPTQIYLLAFVYSLFGPGILISRIFAAACVFGANLLLGALAAKITGRRLIGYIVGGTAMATPWMFEVGRLVLETFFYPMAVTLFLWAVYKAHQRAEWSWLNVIAIAFTLSLLTYSYTIGRVLSSLLALGLVSFATDKKRMISVGKTWVVFAVTMIPLIVFNLQNPGLTTRFYLISYIKPTSTWSDIFPEFIYRFFENLNPLLFLFRGDINPRHHIPDALGSFYFAAFLLAVAGVVVIVLRYRRNAWWRFIVFGALASVVPASLTLDRLHTLRMVAFPVFLFVLMIPALEWLTDIAGPERNIETPREKLSLHPRAWLGIKASVLIVLMAVMVVEAGYFHFKYYERGPLRGYVFDAAYKDVYDAAVARPDRPIYLVDAYWGPAYIHSYWYATIEGRNTSEFVHQPHRVRAPAGSLVISTEQVCADCDLLMKRGDYLLYKVSR